MLTDVDGSPWTRRRSGPFVHLHRSPPAQEPFADRDPRNLASSLQRNWFFSLSHTEIPEHPPEDVVRCDDSYDTFERADGITQVGRGELRG